MSIDLLRSAMRNWSSFAARTFPGSVRPKTSILPRMTTCPQTQRSAPHFTVKGRQPKDLLATLRRERSRGPELGQLGPLRETRGKVGRRLHPQIPFQIDDQGLRDILAGRHGRLTLRAQDVGEFLRRSRFRDDLDSLDLLPLQVFCCRLQDD